LTFSELREFAFNDEELDGVFEVEDSVRSIEDIELTFDEQRIDELLFEEYIFQIIKKKYN
jgi:hypothetical protein